MPIDKLTVGNTEYAILPFAHLPPSERNYEYMRLHATELGLHEIEHQNIEEQLALLAALQTKNPYMTHFMLAQTFPVSVKGIDNDGEDLFRGVALIIVGDERNPGISWQLKTIHTDDLLGDAEDTTVCIFTT
jgi:hypothetical protein